jgi:CRISPR/Cas system endoribonuclease Cas6 (RAMP superfamily)
LTPKLPEIKQINPSAKNKITRIHIKMFTFIRFLQNAELNKKEFYFIEIYLLFSSTTTTTTVTINSILFNERVMMVSTHKL